MRNAILARQADAPDGAHPATRSPRDPIAELRTRGLGKGFQALHDRGVLGEDVRRLAPVGVKGACVKIAPPLIITEPQIDGFLTALPDILDTAQEAA